MQTPVFWEERGIGAKLLSPVGVLFGALGRWRRRSANSVAANVPIICIGNLVAGGAGKTPVALSLANRLQESGCAVHFLSRGYGGAIRGPHRVDRTHDGADRVGDEALLLAAVSPTWVARDRVAGARAAERAGAAVIVMDDGFQNLSLQKNLSIVVVDGAYGFGNELLIPAGPLRELVADGMARADVVVILGDDQAGVRQKIPTHLRVLTAKLVPGPEGTTFAGRRVIAFAGIGRPKKFFNTLHNLGCKLVGSHAFADHHRYREHELLLLADKADKLDAVLVTTAKDMVRVPEAFRSLVDVLSVEVSWDDESVLDMTLRHLVADR